MLSRNFCRPRPNNAQTLPRYPMKGHAMLFYAMLRYARYAMLCYASMFCDMLCYAMLCCAVLYYGLLFCAMLFFEEMLCYAVCAMPLYYSTLLMRRCYAYATLPCAALRCAMLCYAMLCYAMLCGCNAGVIYAMRTLCCVALCMRCDVCYE